MAKRIERELAGLDQLIAAWASRHSGSLTMAYLDHQRPVFECKTKNIVLAKGRQVGGTIGSLLWLLPAAMQGAPCLWVDVGFRQIMKYYNRYIRKMLKSLPPRGYAWNQQLLQLSFPSGGFIDFGSMENPEAMEGSNYRRVVINEAGIVLRNESLYYNTILPMTMHIEGCRQLVQGTPKGKGLFYKLYCMGKDPLEKDWAAFSLDAWQNPFTDGKALARYSRQMPPKTYAQEIMGQFIDDKGLYFESLDSLFDPGIAGTPDPSGIYVIGVDLGKKSDYTVTWVGEMQRRVGVRCDRYNKLPWPETCRRLETLSRLYNGARLVLDATGLGDVVLDDLRARGLNVTGLVFTNQVKAELIGNLNADMSYGRLRCAPDDMTKRELEVFEQKVLPSGMVRLEAPSDFHDDCVIALALLNHGLGRPDGNSVVLIRQGFAADYPVDFGERL